METAELVTKARAGDADALETLMKERRSEVVRYAMRLCVSPEDAEDATQEALLALSKSIGALREVAALSGWLFKAVRTHCLRLARRSLRYALAHEPGETIALEGPSPEDQLVDHRLRQELARVLAALGEDAREVIVRRDILGESTAEAADGLGISEKALKSRLFRARQEAKTMLLRSLAK
ncbi:MAG TPA: sigma-70 family RNA polymerase sigma factor [Polyangiaceae bacterium]